MTFIPKSQKSRSSKQLGDFGEGFVTYVLIRKHFEVACVKHVGADLIAAKNNKAIAVSVKTRLYKKDSKETRGIVITPKHIKNLKWFADLFKLEPVFAHVVSFVDDATIHVFMLRVADIERHVKKVRHSYRLNISKAHLDDAIKLPYVDHSIWNGETIGDKM